MTIPYPAADRISPVTRPLLSPSRLPWPRGLPLRLEGVRLSRGATTILNGVDLDIPADRRLLLLGPSGAGKSTLLRLLNRLDDPDSGRILLGDLPLPSLPVRLLRRAIAVVPQDPLPLPGSIRDNLLAPSEFAGLKPPPDAELALALDEFGLNPSWLDRDASALSGGERRRLAIAVSLQTSPEILALDEPTAALDPASSRRLVEAIDRRVRADALRTIVVTHDRRLAPILGDVAVVLDAGRVVDLGPTLDVLRRADPLAWGSDAPLDGQEPLP
ncbi:ABC transporter ATP-binding protein [Tautonia sociabilis]|uniref:ATP-binding cassette domain-containing protein n=1 Tax=Tautonia sociabilis TaxID=2080755 RepID=A0A432MMK6_9BACT|nr:ATP-binding cassette domain-containing protein [Tautonia sociabilis]RUL88335.1 ATP-binding cassette domain-containing protein [Tautonia sociabilis]